MDCLQTIKEGIAHYAPSNNFFLRLNFVFHDETYKRDDLLGKVLLPFVVSFSISGLFQNTINDGENMFVIMFLYSLTQATQAYKDTKNNL